MKRNKAIFRQQPQSHPSPSSSSILPDTITIERNAYETIEDIEWFCGPRGPEGNYTHPICDKVFGSSLLSPSPSSRECSSCSSQSKKLMETIQSLELPSSTTTTTLSSSTDPMNCIMGCFGKSNMFECIVQCLAESLPKPFSCLLNYFLQYGGCNHLVPGEQSREEAAKEAFFGITQFGEVSDELKDIYKTTYESIVGVNAIQAQWSSLPMLIFDIVVLIASYFKGIITLTVFFLLLVLLFSLVFGLSWIYSLWTGSIFSETVSKVETMVKAIEKSLGFSLSKTPEGILSAVCAFMNDDPNSWKCPLQ